jgi:hypothetical protein
MPLSISGDSPNFTSASLTTPTITGAVVSSMASSVITSGTAVASTSGTSIDFTALPSWVKRITVMFTGVSTNGTSPIQIQLGTGSTTYTTSGYLGAGGGFDGAGTSVANASSGFVTEAGSAAAAAAVRHGSYTITNVTGNTWAIQGSCGLSNGTILSFCGGSIALAAALTAVRITTVGGTNTFDAGSINILYE